LQSIIHYHPHETSLRLDTEGGGVDGGRKRMTTAHSEGGGAGVNGGRKRTMMTRSEGGRVEVSGLRKRTTMARSEARVEAAVCSEAGGKATVCSGVEIEDGRRR
jgi:hypothetical protein